MHVRIVYKLKCIWKAYGIWGRIIAYVFIFIFSYFIWFICIWLHMPATYVRIWGRTTLKLSIYEIISS